MERVNKYAELIKTIELNADAELDGNWNWMEGIV